MINHNANMLTNEWNMQPYLFQTILYSVQINFPTLPAFTLLQFLHANLHHLHLTG